MEQGDNLAMENVPITFKWRRLYRAKKDALNPNNSSMDYNEVKYNTHPRRLLLMAEPQVCFPEKNVLAIN